LPSYRFGVRRKAQVAPLVVEPPENEPSYRELQSEAKELGIPANQKADDLKAAIEDHSDE